MLNVIKMIAVNFTKSLLFPKELHTCSKISRVSIKVTALKIMSSFLFPQELYIFVKMCQVLIKINFVSIDKLYVNALFPQRNYTHFPTRLMLASKWLALTFTKSSLFPEELYVFVKMSQVLINANFVNIDKLCKQW